MEIKRAINTARYAGCVFSRLRLISRFLIHDKTLSLFLPIPWAHMLT